MTENKVRVSSLSKDFGFKGSKEIKDLMTAYRETPKNHTQTLTIEDLDVLIAVLTEKNQVESIEEIFADVKSVSSDAPPAEVVEVDVAEKASVPVAPPSAPKPPKADSPKHTERKTKLVDTRGASVDLSKYDERVEQLVPEKAGRMKQGKEKIRKTSDRRNNISLKKKQEEQARQRARLEHLRNQPIKVLIPEEIAVSELAARLKKTGAQVVAQLVKMGIFSALSDVIDFETASLVAMEFNAKVEKEIILTIEERLIDITEDEDHNLLPRDPVVVVMGHVDHGKTSLLDYIRNADVVAGEAGGITQHIGAYRVKGHLPGKNEERHVTFLDTPGHAAFTSMRARGASMTDIAILVVAADDGIMPQTIEAIDHAKSAEVPILVAVNKIDKPGADPSKIKQQLTEHGVVPEDWGGETVVCEVSAKTGEGVPHLLEMLLLTAEMGELRANPDRVSRGTVVEAKLDKARGPVATVLVQNGTLKQGDVVIAGKAVGRVRAMTDDKGIKLETAGPSVPVEIIGLAEVPEAGDVFHTVEDERMARELAKQRKQEEKDEKNRTHAVSLEDIYARIKEGQIKNLNVIVKADVQGSAEAVKASLEKIQNEEVRVRVIHAGVGAVNETDVLLANTASAIVVGFNVRADAGARQSAANSGVDVRFYRVIYDCIEEIESAMKGLLTPKFKEVVLGRAEVRKVFKASNIGTVAGSFVLEGVMRRNGSLRVVRDGIVVFEGEMSSLKRFKDDVKEVASGYECGISAEKYTDIREGDVLDCYVMEEIAR